ncbi:MAG: hypothetical protein ACXVPU_06200 [Bacteroidia bacterium]
MISVKRLLVFLLLSASSFCFSQIKYGKDTTLIRTIQNNGIYDDDFIRKTLYTWTTPEQINELRTGKKLLLKSKSNTGDLSLYDKALRDSTFKGIPVIQLLKQPQFSKKRYAWINCWSTCMGTEEEKYGGQLIRIVLNADAIIGKLDVLNLPDPIQFFNLKGEKLSAAFAIENQDKIAVIYHENMLSVKRTQEQEKRSGSRYVYNGKYKKEKVNIKYSEFVIVNEKMVTWSYGTEEIKNEIASEINYLKQLSLSEKANQLGYRDNCDHLKAGSEYDDVNCAFESNKCFNIDYYIFNKERLQKIIDTLEQDLKQQSAPITN